MTTVTIPAPAAWFTPNGRRHWAETGRLVKAWRDAACWHARALKPMPFYTVPVVITATIHKTTRRVFDAPNLLGGSVKAAIDGIVDAGMLAGDDGRYVTETRIRAGEPRRPACLVLEIEPAA